ncbi:MAG: hypothetical protein AABM43_12235 [Actinomycetota bacterium]
MLATYASVISVCIASLAIGQAALAVCGWRRWSWLAPATGLALVTALCWATVRLPGDGVISAIAVVLLTITSLAFLLGRVEGVGAALRDGAPVAIGALVAASLPFIVEGRFGILGTSFNPDMSQHLLAADRLAQGSDSQLLAQGYPLGPHAIVVALNKGLGVGLVHGFGGLTLAVSVLASLTALAALSELRPLARWIAALLVGLPYMVASYLAQGAFKETMQALFVLAFAITVWQLSSVRDRSGEGGRRGVTGRAMGWLATGRTPAPPPNAQLAAVPLALLAAGSAYTYSFPGLTWLAGALGLWALAELLLVRQAGGAVIETVRRAVRPGWLALIVFVGLVAPELGRMVDFGSFETFDPNGPGLGNLFGQISPTEALGMWPSGDFRLTPGAGAVPAIGFYAGVAFAAVLLVWGLVWWLRRGETTLPAALAAAALAYAAARIGGTPYTAAKAVQMAAPLAMVVIVRPLLSFDPEALRPGSLVEVVRPLAAAAFVVAAGGCSLLALANGPVGPSSYSPALTSLRPVISSASTLVMAPASFLRDQHGAPYVAWELRGGRVCIRSTGPPSGSPPPAGVRFVVTRSEAGARPPFADLRLARTAGPYLLWRRAGLVGGASPCPLIAVHSARQGEKQGG